MAYHSSAIEGNTITLPEVSNIFLERSLPKYKTIREFYEIENHKQAFEFLFDNINNNVELNIDLLLNMHKYLVDRLQHNAGNFKSSQNAIVGAKFQTTSPTDTPYLIRQWIDNTNYRLNNTDEDNENIKYPCRHIFNLKEYILRVDIFVYLIYPQICSNMLRTPHITHFSLSHLLVKKCFFGDIFP